LGAAVRMNPLFLPATLATVAITIGLTAWEMDNMSKRAKEAEQKLSVTASTVGMTSEEFSNLSSILGTGSAALADYSSAVVDVSTKIDILNKKINELEKQQEKINKRNTKGGQNVKGVEDEIAELNAELEKQNQKKADENAKLNQSFISYATGDLKNLEHKQLTIIDKQIAAVSTIADQYDAAVRGSDDYILSLNIALDLAIKEGDILEQNRDIIYQTLLNRKDLNNVSASGNKADENSLRTQNKLMDELKKNEIDFKHGVDLAKRFDIDPKSNRGIVLNITGVDLGQIANTLALPDAIKKANMHIFLKQFDNTTGGKTQGALDYLNKQASDFIKMSKANDLGAMTNGFIGSKVNFGLGFFKSTGATAAYQVARGSIKASAEFYSNLKKIDDWNNSLRGQEIKTAASLITGEAAWFTKGNEKKARKLSQAESDTLSLAGAFGFRPSNIDKVDGIIKTTVDSMISESNAFLNSMTGSIPGSMISGVFSAAGSLIQNIQKNNASALYSAGPSGRYQLQQDINKSKNAAAASLFNNVVSRFNGGNYGEYDATVMSTLLGATFAHPEIAQEYTSFQTKIAPILGITHNEFTSVLSESTRGYSEIDDRMRYKGRLEQISTGATVF
jgi:predicted  nucleic acid-binding Zn-ribbon protein